MRLPAPRPPRPLGPLLLLAVLGLFALSPRAGAEPPATPREIPLPTTRTVVLKDTDVVYVVDGRQTIPRGVEVTGQKGIRIRGRNAAALEVKGGFVVHGIKGTEVRIAGVRIEPGESVQQLHLDHCALEGTTVVTADGKTTDGLITVENCGFDSGNGVKIAMTGGKVKVMNVVGSTGIRIRAVDLPDNPNRIDVMVMGCKLNSGIEVQNAYDAVVRSCLLSGGPLLLRGNRTLLFDSNRVTATPLVIEQPVAGAFGNTTITKNDFVMETLRIFAPAEEGKTDVVTLDKCWFVVGTKPADIATVVEDAADDPKNGVKVRLKSPNERPHNLHKDDE